MIEHLNSERAQKHNLMENVINISHQAKILDLKARNMQDFGRLGN